MEYYHAEPKEYGPFEFTDGKVTVYYSFIEHWVSAGHSQTVKCARTTADITYSRTFGISISEFESLKTSIGSSIGPAGLASIASNIEANTQITTTFTGSSTIGDKFTYKSPGCGRATYFVEQLVRDFQLVIQKPGFIGKPRPVPHNFRELTDNFQLRIDSDDQFPDCPCPPTDEIDLGEILRLKLAKLFARVDAKRDKQNSLTFKIGKRAYAVALDADSNSGEVHLRQLPRLFRVLGGFDSTDIVAEVVLEKDFNLSDLSLSRHEVLVAAAGFA